MERHNGWKNYDTWLVVVWLSNDEPNYERIRKYQKLDVEELTLDDLENVFYYGGDAEVINFDNVDLDEIKAMLLEEL